VLEEQRGDVRIVDQVAGDARSADERVEDLYVIGRLAEKNQRGAGKNRPRVRQGDRHWNGRMIDARMGDDPQELVDAGPGNGPRYRALGKRAQEIARSPVVSTRYDLRLNKHIGVDRPHRLPAVHQIEQLVPVQDV
jgi:hypothetical protein